MEDQVKEYEGFDSWYPLYEKYKDADFNIKENREAFNNDFEEISKLMWQCWIDNNDTESVAEAIATMWCSGFEKQEHESIADMYDTALGRLEYSSDRMNINRWMLIRILLNYGVE